MSKLFDWLTNRPGYILGGAAVVYLVLGWGQDGINLDSATYATIARNMAETGQWFSPHYTNYYHPAFAEHPPLVIWLQGLVFLLFGAGDTTARIVGALCTLGSVMVVYQIGRELLGKSFGFLAGLTLLLTYNFIQIGNSTLLDVPMTFFVLVAVYGMALMHLRGVTTSNALLTGAALGLAWLSKGVVSAPAWIALALTCLFFHRRWLRKREFWFAPAAGLAIIAFHLLLDQLFADGHFTRHYFLTQISRTFLGRAPTIDTEWWEFSYRFAKLYLPFILLFPFGVYLTVKKRLGGLYPVLITFVFYSLFYSVAAKLYYHYFCPVYALAAPVAALPLAVTLKDRHVRRVAAVFIVLWVTAAVIIRAAGVRVHEIRTAEVYNLKDSMIKLLEATPSRDGVCIGHHPPNWDHVAKAAWYWRSEIRQISTGRGAVGLLESGDYAYLIVEKSDSRATGQIGSYLPDRLQPTLENEKVIIYTLRPPKSVRQSSIGPCTGDLCPGY